MIAPRSILFGVPIDGYTMPQVLDVIDQCVRSGRATGHTYQVTTVNVDFLVNAVEDPEVMALLQRAEVNLADGMPLLWASKSLGTPLPERVAGADLVPLLGSESAKRGWRIHLFGAGPGVAQRARDRLQEMEPDALVTADSGPSAIDVHAPDESVVGSIRAVNPDVLCVALGNPKQERFIATYRDALRCPVMIGVGGSLDMLVGDKKRAPGWAQRVGAEWVFRAAQEPGRLGRRYAHDLRVFGPAVHRYRRSVVKYAPRSATVADTSTGRRNVFQRISQASTLLDDGVSATGVEIDLGGVDDLTPTEHAKLVGLLRDAGLSNKSVAVERVSENLRTCFEDYGTWKLLKSAMT